MKYAFLFVVVIHAAIHLMGVAKAFHLAKIEQLNQPISPTMGVLWLGAAVAFFVTAGLLAMSSHAWWGVGLTAVVLSQVAIVASWRDAKFGTIANLIVLLPAAVALYDLRDQSFGSIYRAAVERGLVRTSSVPKPAVTDADLAKLPPLVQTYLRRAGVVGRPRVVNMRLRLVGGLRSSHESSWMDMTVDQVTFFDQPTRIFLVDAARFGLPFEALHLYEGAAATMRVRIASLLEVVDARGPEMNQSETVTMFNDMCLLAPATLVDAPIVWTEEGGRTVSGSFSNAGNTIRAKLTFDAAGDLVSFVSDDRYQSADGKKYEKFPWITPVAGYRDFGVARIGEGGEAIWKEPRGDFPYARMKIESIEYNVSSR